MESAQSFINHSNVETVNIQNGMGYIYFLFMEGTIVYVGKSMSLFSRIGSHLGKKKFDRMSCIKVRSDMIDNFEVAFIKHFRPSLNKTKHGQITSEEMKLIEKYVSVDALKSSHFTKFDSPSEGDYGPVAFYLLDDEIVGQDDGGVLTLGVYDDDELEDCLGCEEGHDALEAARTLFPDGEIPGDIMEVVHGACKCEPLAIVYGETGTFYYLADRRDLLSISLSDLPDFLRSEVTDMELKSAAGRFGISPETLKQRMEEFKCGIEDYTNHVNAWRPYGEKQNDDNRR